MAELVGNGCLFTEHIQQILQLHYVHQLVGEFVDVLFGSGQVV